MTEQKYAIKLEPIKYGYRDGPDGTPRHWKKLEFDVFNDEFIGRARVYINNNACPWHYFERHPDNESKAIFHFGWIENDGLTENQIIQQAAKSIRSRHDYTSQHINNSEKIAWRPTTEPIIERKAEIEAEPITVPIMV